MLFQKGQTILFQGDSVTDCGRNKEDPHDLGQGYALLAASRLMAEHPQLDLRFYNRGISGNRSRDLVSRWQKDCLDLKPDWVSILIGINDTWRRYDSNDPTPAIEYGRNLKKLCQMTVAAGARLIIMEPFFLPHPPERQAWHEDLAPKLAQLRQAAYAYASCYIPLEGIFHAAAIKQAYPNWAVDGVHPTMAGHALISQAFLEAINNN